MQTFLPYDSYRLSAKALDRSRLGKQRLECKQILQTLMGESTAWANHPAVKMWRGYEKSLCEYAIEICLEWRSRGYMDTQLPWFGDVYRKLPPSAGSRPPWLGDPLIHLSHKGNLVRKDPDWYGPLFPGVQPMMGYFWPGGEG